MFKTNEIQEFQRLETPFYYYDLGLLRKTLESYTANLKNVTTIMHIMR